MSDVRQYGVSDGWGEHVRFDDHTGFAYRPGEVITAGAQGRDAATRVFPGNFPDVSIEPLFEEVDEAEGAANLYLMKGEVDAVEVVEELRLAGVLAQPNHVLFAHGCGCCGPHPADRWAASGSSSLPVAGSPLHGSPLHGSPLRASPLHGSPVTASPLHGSDAEVGELRLTGWRRSSALPATSPLAWRIAPAAASQAVRVAVLDTGMAGDGYRPAELDALRPAAVHWEEPDGDHDQHLDPAAGHGTFIAGLIHLLAPTCEITVERVLSNYGEGDEAEVACRIDALAGTVDIINLSLGGYASVSMYALARAIRRAKGLGTIVVASAGNEGSCRPTYPAALPDVVGVGAIGPSGPAWFTNYGPWVRACAPGVDVVSWFFSQYEGKKEAAPGSVDPDHFESWARWSGTSFSAPVVVAALAREMLTHDVDAAGAVRRVIDGPGLLRIPDLGTVVNLTWQPAPEPAGATRSSRRQPAPEAAGAGGRSRRSIRRWRSASR